MRARESRAGRGSGPESRRSPAAISHRVARVPATLSWRRPWRWHSHWLAALVCSAFLLGGCRGGGDFPSQPIVLVCPWAAGGGTDRVARQVAAGLERELGVPVNVVNATGASGVTGHTRGALARPDGHTLTIVTVELNMLHWRGLTSITHEDFRPGALVNRDPAALFVRDDAPWRDLAELNQHVRAHPGERLASGTALGGIWHAALAGWLVSMGLEADAVRWISIEGSTPSLQELMAGGLDLVSCSLPEARPLLEAGRIRCLGVASEERLPDFPEVPTLREQGVDWVLGTWRGIAMPAETPDEVAEVLEAALAKVVQGEEYRGFMKQAGFNWDYEGPEDFGATLAAVDRQFGELLGSEAFASMDSKVIGPMAFPALLGVLGAVILGCLLAGGGLRRSEAAETCSRAGLLRVVEVLGAVALYLLLAESLGFVLTAFPLCAALMWRLGVRWWRALALALAVAAFVYQVFAVLLRVPLPRGLFGW